MKNTLKSIILPVCLSVIIVVTLIDYIKYGDIKFTQLCIIFALIPMAIEGIKPALTTDKNFKYFRLTSIILAFGMLAISSFIEM